MNRQKKQDWFPVINAILLGLLAICCLYPFIYVLSASFSSSESVSAGRVWLWPVEANVESYVKVFEQKQIWISYGNTIFYTVVGTSINLLLTAMGAYPLSKRRLAGRSFFGFFIAFTILFGAGLIPSYLNYRDLGLMDSRWAILLGGAVSAMNLIIFRTFLQEIPEELEESAKIDGANDWTILWKVFLPLSRPALATIGLFYAVGHWNSYFMAMILLRSESKIPLQVYLNKIIVQLQVPEEIKKTMDVMPYSPETVIYATIMVAVIPIILVYPMIQKHFVKGVMIGSLKG
ncbi:carbohydrate ABC transporter permease [Paenibacillus montanisoli]|uniref:Carbohydrate ABC transporter permease n=1 Tax=Paenibacillus montanisoli TaxID=2081970 RepID=A0A328TTC7_9BACL|nr:carbohydrate ABC transporter permease [Paenibacillus montanisoli]RAP73560.1 carbohydrate ABC transporter permease [Paenibacillus montanisoli]